MNLGELSILIADDHPLFRAALQQVIAQLYPQATLYQAANVAELQQQVEQHNVKRKSIEKSVNRLFIFRRLLIILVLL